MSRCARKFALTVVLCVAQLLVYKGMALAAPPTPPGAKWTVMVYMSGDNDLESYIVKDLEEELALDGSSTDVQVVALADRIPGDDASRGDWTTTKLFHVTAGMTATPENAVADWGERNFGDPQTLVDFVTWAKAEYPADRYALFLWGHGWNWHPGWTMQDDTDADTLDAHEIAAALPSLGFIDVVGFDGCNMASIEVQELWRGYATAVVASQEYVNWDGLEYELIIAALHANPDMSTDEMAVVSNQSASVNSERTWSAVAIDGRWDALLTAVDEWSLALVDGLAANRSAYARALNATQGFWGAPMDMDLYDLAYEMNRKVSDPAVVAASQAVMTAVDGVVLDEWHTKAYHGAHGITIYMIEKPSQIDDDHAYYQGLGFSLLTNWDEFVDAFVSSP
jgi:hypothetical protein